MEYTCPVCSQSVERELLVFIDHTEQHIVDEIKKKHPEWVGKNGVCRKCLDHFRQMMKGK